jgi:hypothetical protein
MKEKRQIFGCKYIMCKGKIEGSRTGVTSDIHFTVLAFTAGTGEVIICAVVMKLNKDIKKLPICWNLGVDVSKDVLSGKTMVEAYNLNYESGALIRGPKCTFKGQVLPCFVCTSQNASITSNLLVEMLKTIDNTGLLPLLNELGMPFLLFDGHHSQTSLPFLKYVNN